MKPVRVLHAPTPVNDEIEIVDTFIGDDFCGTSFADYDNDPRASNPVRGFPVPIGETIKISAPNVSNGYLGGAAVTLDGGFGGDLSVMPEGFSIKDDMDQALLCRVIEFAEVDDLHRGQYNFEQQKLYLQLERTSSELKKYELLRGFLSCAYGPDFFRLRRIGPSRAERIWPGDVVRKHLRLPMYLKKFERDISIHYYFNERGSDEESLAFLKAEAVKGDGRFQFEYAAKLGRADSNQAIEWLERSAKQDYLPAVLGLAILRVKNAARSSSFDDSSEGAPRSQAGAALQETLVRVEQQANKGSPIAISLLAIVYHGGFDGVDEDQGRSSMYACRLAKWVNRLDDWQYTFDDIHIPTVLEWCQKEQA